jgi:tyrosine-protein kinase
MQEQRITGIIWRGKWLVALSLVLSLALAVFITEHSSKVYAANAILQVNSPGGGATNPIDPLQQLQANQSLATTYATVIDDRSFLVKIRPSISHGAYTVSQLESMLSASPITNTALIKLTAQGSSPQLAQVLAAGVSNAFLRTFKRDTGNRAAAQQRAIQAKINALGNDRSESARLARAALTQQLAALIANNIAESGSVSLTAPPTASSDPIKPKPTLNYLAGILLGLLLGIFLAWLRERLDRGLHSSEEAEELLSAPVLAAIPLRKRYVAEDLVVNEAHDILRANLAFLSLDQALQVITFTSYNPNEGKTSTVEGLAYAAVRGGMSVLVIDGDVRTASLSTRFGARSMPGLTSVIVGTVSIDDAVLDVEQGLSLLPAGPTPPNPPSLLSSGRMREVLAELRDRHSLIIIDSPPVAHLADASILASVSDGVILVARVGVTARADLPAAVTNLRHSPTPIVGTVLLRPQLIDETYYPVALEGRNAIPESVLDR